VYWGKNKEFCFCPTKTRSKIPSSITQFHLGRKIADGARRPWNSTPKPNKPLQREDRLLNHHSSSREWERKVVPLFVSMKKLDNFIVFSLQTQWYVLWNGGAPETGGVHAHRQAFSHSEPLPWAHKKKWGRAAELRKWLRHAEAVKCSWREAHTSPASPGVSHCKT
jgi:hypothetical protein